MYPDSSNLHGDHYGFGQNNVNPNSTLTNAPKGQNIGGLPKQDNELNIGGLGAGINESVDKSSSISGVPMVSNTINDHNNFQKINNMAVSKENAEIPKESGNVKVVLIIGIVLLILIVIAILCVLFLGK